MNLSAGDLEARVEGGTHLSVASLRHRGKELLVSPEELTGPYRVHDARAGITLLHPWANRLEAGVEVPGDAPRDPHGLPIHGLPLAWTLDDGRAVADVAFPAPHRVVVAFALDPGGLTVTTRLEAGETAVPVAFGWHPYFRLPGVERGSWELSLPDRRRLEADDQGLPTGAVHHEAAETLALGGRAFDDGYDAILEGTALAVAGGGREIRVVLERGYPAAQVFAPTDAAVVSPEPMTAVTNAWASGDVHRVAPGEAFEAIYRVEVTG